MSKSKILLGVLGGDAAGTLLGMLFAPEKGSKTRNKIKKQ
jgi:gas vesicle protein